MKRDNIFIGREKELSAIGKLYKEAQSQLTVVYGRRRIGKTAFIEKFCEGKDHFYFTGRKSEKQGDLFRRLLNDIARSCNNPLISKVAVNDWNEIFEIIDSAYDKKMVIVFDEFQWMCTKYSTLISALQEHWDKKWKDSQKVFLVLCGSIISFMEKNVLSEKSPLYGRRTASFELEAMPASEAKLFFPSKNAVEQAETIMTFGGVPSYLELINTKESLAQNINRLALTKDCYFFNEIEFILREQLKNPARYYSLLESIAGGSSTRKELAQALNIGNSGALDLYLKSLQKLHLLKESKPITKSATAKTQRYMIWDEFLRFYFTFIYPNKERIQLSLDDWLYDSVISPKWESYCGYSFELFCRKNMKAIILLLQIEKVFERSGTYWRSVTKSEEGLQIDIVIERTDKITHLIECKWSSGKIGASVLGELERKKKLYPNPLQHTLKTAIATLHGVTEQVASSGMIDDIILATDILNSP